LGDAGEQISIDDLRFDPRQTVQKFLSNCSQFGKDTVLHSKDLLSRHIQVTMDGDPLSNPFAGKYQGMEELEALFYKFFQIFIRDGGTLGDATQMRLVGQEVIAWGHEYIRVPEAPLSLPNFVMLRIEFRNGLITRIENFYEATGLMSRIAAWAKLYPNANWVRYFDLDILRSRLPVEASLPLGRQRTAGTLCPPDG
jgi:hypothetical protein